MSEKENESKSYFPFSGYDIFGYIIPGGIFFLSIFIFDFWAKESMGFKHNPIVTLIGLFKPDGAENHFTTFSSIVFAIAAILVIYVIGHTIAALSSFFIDRILIKKGHHYPIKSILIKEHKDSDGSKSIKGTFTLFNLSILSLHACSCIYLAFTYSVHKHDWIYWHIGLLVVFLFILLSFIFMFSYNLIVRFLKPFYWFYDLFSNHLRHIVGSEGGISKEVEKNYRKFLKKELKLRKTNLTTDVYWLSYIYISRKSPSALKLLMNWMQLYSFSRNLSTGFFISFVYCVISISVNSHLVNDYNYTHVHKFKIFIGCLIPVIYWLLSLLFLLRFYYLYHGYYSKFIIRTCSFLYQKQRFED